VTDHQNYEAIEKVRQQIMRLRELLAILTQTVRDGEGRYAQLFSACSEEDKQRLKEKDLQWKAAEHLLTNRAALSRTALHLRIATRDISRSFEELYDIIESPPDALDEIDS